MKIINKIRKAIAKKYCNDCGYYMITTYFLECLPTILGMTGVHLKIEDDKLWIWNESDLAVKKPICFHDDLDKELNKIEKKKKQNKNVVGIANIVRLVRR